MSTPNFLQELERNISRLVAQIEAPVEMAMRQMKVLESSVAESLDSLNRTFSSIVSAAIDHVATLPRHVPAAQEYCSANSWFLPHDLVLWESEFIAEHSADGDVDAIENRLVTVTRARLPSVATKVHTYLRDREHLLLQAFASHDQRLFGAAIPLLLAQADGIHYTLFNGSLFKQNAVQKVQQRLKPHFGEGPRAQRLAFDLAYLLFRQLRESNALTATTREPLHAGETPATETLNRHAVLHGHDLDYATEANALRSFMLIELLCDTCQLLAWAEERTPTGS